MKKIEETKQKDGAYFDLDSWTWIIPHNTLAASQSLASTLEELRNFNLDQEGVNYELEYAGDVDNVGEPMRKKFTDIMNNYPNGISVFTFLSVFKNAHGYFPDYTSLQYSSVENMCRSVRRVFWVTNSPIGEPLLFPAASKDQICHPLELFHETWIKIQSLLRFNNNVLKVDDIPDKFFRTYKVKIDPSDWHYGDELAFISYCLKLWQPKDPIYLLADPNRVFILMQPSATLAVDKNRKEIKEEGQFKTAMVAKGFSENTLSLAEFVRFGDELKYVVDDIEEGTYFKCLAGAVLTPGDFYVNLMHNWNDLERLMNRMQKVYEKPTMFQLQNQQPHPEALVVGLYIAAKRAADSQWHRAQIIKKYEDGTYTVLNIDYGDIMTVTIDSMRYLTTELLERLKAQAVWCVAHLRGYYDASIPQSRKNHQCGPGWNESDGDILRAMINDKYLAIKFVSKIKIEGWIPAWLVYIHVLDVTSKIPSIRIEDLHIERQVIQHTRGVYVPRWGEDTDKSGQVSLVSSKELPSG